jgi:Sel1 repeat
MTDGVRRLLDLRNIILIASLCLGADWRARAETTDALAAPLVDAQSQPGAAYCDRYAASEFDNRRLGPGMPFDRIDPKAAIPACAEALSRNPDSPRLNFELGRAYSAQGDFAKAREHFLKAANANFALAEVNLATLYGNGLGTPRNDEEAEKWARRAAEQGLAQAEFNLGAMYLQGRGVVQDFAEGAAWLQAAAMQGFAPAEHSLAALYATGKGVRRDIAEAVRLHGLAANQGYAPAQADFPYDLDTQAAGAGYSEAALRPAAPAEPKLEASLTVDKEASIGTGESLQTQPPDGPVESRAPPPPSSAASPNTASPAADNSAPARPAPAIETPGRLASVGASEADAAPVKIVVRRLDHRDSSGIPTMAIELSPLSNRFSLSSLSVNDGACRIYIRDPAIFSPGHSEGPTDHAAKNGPGADQDNKNLNAALSKIALPKVPFDQPMVAEFGQYLQFYADPAVCDVREVAVVVNEREWKWSSQ